MADGDLVVLDGSHLRKLAVSQFDEALTGAHLLARADSIVSAHLFDLPLPRVVKTSALRRIGVLDDEVFLRSELDRDRASETAKLYVDAIADSLKDDPIVIAVLDGSTIRMYLEDEDDIAMIAENLFTDLDVEDKGKIRKSKIRNALVHMGAEMGVPPLSDFPMLESILKKHAVDEEGELGQAQFAVLLQSVLQDLADALANNSVQLVQKLIVMNGSKLRKFLADEKQLSDLVKKFQQEKRDVHSPDILTSVRHFLGKNGLDFGLPPLSVANATLYDLVFDEVDGVEISPEVNEREMLSLMKVILERFAEQLEGSPVYHDVNQ